MDWDILIFNISAFIAALFLLEYGAGKFIDHTAILAQRLHVSSTLIALLTAGAEWEELAVVISALIQHRPSLAIGNVIGSSISNILGAFCLGLLFQTGHVSYDSSSKIYTAVLLAVTSTVAGLMLVGLEVGEGKESKIVGGCLIVGFGVYVGSVAYGIYRGALAPAEDSGDGGNSDEEENGGDEAIYDDAISEIDNAIREIDSAISEIPAPPPPFETGEQRPQDQPNPTESSPLLPNGDNMPNTRPQSSRHSALYHVSQVVLGFLALSLSGYVLSHTASSLADTLHISSTVLGMTILSFATTLPEKFVSVMSGSRGHSGIVVANTTGSNVFLLTLCLGIVFVSKDEGVFGAEGVRRFELGVMWGSSVLLALIVFLGSRRWMGALLLILYLAFLVLEFTMYRR